MEVAPLEKKATSIVLVTIAFCAIAAFFLFAEHRAHLLIAYALLICSVGLLWLMRRDTQKTPREDGPPREGGSSR